MHACVCVLGDKRVVWRTENGENEGWCAVCERADQGTEGGESAIELRSRGHSLEAGTSVAISGTEEGGTFQHKLEPQKSSSPWSGNCLKQRKGD